MINSEKLFLLINEIDEELIEEADGEEEKPVQMKPEPRSRSKGIIALAACVAALAVGIFAIVKFFVKNGIDPIQGDSSEYSSEDQSNSDDSDIEPEFTEEDLELQEILADLAPGFDIAGMFSDGVEAVGPKYRFSVSDSFTMGELFAATYIDVSGNQPWYQFPKSCDELEEMLSKYFTKKLARHYWGSYDIAEHWTEQSDGSYYVSLSHESKYIALGLIEIDGKMFYLDPDSKFEYRGEMYDPYSGENLEGPFDYKTARVVNQTDDTIVFSYVSGSSKRGGKLRYQDGSWKLDMYTGLPVDFTEEDLELQAMLTELVAGAEDIDKMFDSMGADTGITFTSNEYNNGNLYAANYYTGDYYLIPEGRRSESGLFVVPQSYDEMEELVNRYFSSQAASFYMSWVGKGRNMTPNPDGTFNVDVQKGSMIELLNGSIIVRDKKETKPIFIEIDGKMYRSTTAQNIGGLGIDCKTAKVIRKTEKSIEFSYWGYSHKDYFDYFNKDQYMKRTGTITLENGTPKLHFFCDYGFIPQFPAEYTEQDLELQKILKELSPGYMLDSILDNNGVECAGDEYKFVFSDSRWINTYIEVSYPQPEYTFPRSCEELEEILLEYFTQEVTDNYMKRVCKGTMTANPDGTYSVTLDKDLDRDLVFIEINGKMYYNFSIGGDRVPRYHNSAQVIEQTDDAITYSYIITEYDGFKKVMLKLRYERGGWKLDPSYTVIEPAE